jgi:hypothetical protein
MRKYKLNYIDKRISNLIFFPTVFLSSLTIGVTVCGSYIEYIIFKSDFLILTRLTRIHPHPNCFHFDVICTQRHMESCLSRYVLLKSSTTYHCRWWFIITSCLCDRLSQSIYECLLPTCDPRGLQRDLLWCFIIVIFDRIMFFQLYFRDTY